MTRYAKPKAGRVAQFSENIMESGDGAWYPVVGGIFSVITSGAAIFAVDTNPLVGLLFAPALFFGSTVVGYLRGTDHIAKKDASSYYQAKYFIMPKIEGTFVEEYAKPLLDQIWDHSIEGHPGVGYNSTVSKCPLCFEREQTMRELVPDKPTNKADIERAKAFIEERKRFELES